MKPILADSSVWIANFRSPDELFAELGRSRRLRIHPFVIGELALGTLPRRDRTLADLAAIRTVRVATHLEVMDLIEAEGLSGRGIGYVDAHLLAACLITPGVGLWTRDKALGDAATRLGLGAQLTN